MRGIGLGEPDGSAGGAQQGGSEGGGDARVEMIPSKGYGGDVDEKVWQRIEASMKFEEGEEGSGSLSLRVLGKLTGFWSLTMQAKISHRRANSVR